MRCFLSMNPAAQLVMTIPIIASALLVSKLRLVVKRLLVPLLLGRYLPQLPCRLLLSRKIGSRLDFVEDVGADCGLPSASSRDLQPHAVEEADDLPSMAELFGPDDAYVAPAAPAPVHRSSVLLTHTSCCRLSWFLPEDKKRIEGPCARLCKALYRHALSSASWSLRLDSSLKSLSGQQFPNLPSVYYFPRLSLVLCAYVDDLTLSGPTIHHEGFWSSLSTQVDLEPFTLLGRVLGRSHRFVLQKSQSLVS